MTDQLSAILFIGSAVTATLALTGGGLALGVSLGCILSVLRQSCAACRMPINCLISLIRGTPLLLQMGLIYFSLPSITGIKLDVTTAGIIAFGLNSSAYVAEILRGGIESLPRGQFEAARTLEIPTFYMWRDIILRQVVRNVFPSLVNEVVSLLKETAIISTIGGFDIMRASQMVAAQQFEYFAPLCIAGAYYYALVLMIEFVGKKVERKISL